MVKICQNFSREQLEFIRLTLIFTFSNDLTAEDEIVCRSLVLSEPTVIISFHCICNYVVFITLLTLLLEPLFLFVPKVTANDFMLVCASC